MRSMKFIFMNTINERCGPMTRYGSELSVLVPDQNIELWVVMLS